MAKVQATDLSAFIALTGIASGDRDTCRATEACSSLPAKTWSSPYAVVTAGVVYGPAVSPMMSDADVASFRKIALGLADTKETPWSVAASLGPDRSVQVMTWTRSYAPSVAPPAQAGALFTLYEFVGPWDAEAAVADVDRVLWPGVAAAVLLVGAMAWLMTGDSLGRLEWAQERQRRFIADASHELRNPIASLRAELEVALAHPGRADWPAVTADALADVERMAGLADSLLLLARLDGGEPLPAMAVDVAEVARACVAGRRLRAGPGLGLTCRAAGTVLVTGSATQLGRMLGNLLDNALRHARSAVTVTVRTEAGAVLLEVEDDGSGVATADRGRVFERFGRLDPGRAREEGGAHPALGHREAGAGERGEVGSLATGAGGLLLGEPEQRDRGGSAVGPHDPGG